MTTEHEYPHVPAAFINAIAEEGTKAEAVEYLQRQWNECCAQAALIKELMEALKPFVDAGKDAEGYPDNHRLGCDPAMRLANLTVADLRRICDIAKAESQP